MLSYAAGNVGGRAASRLSGEKIQRATWCLEPTPLTVLFSVCRMQAFVRCPDSRDGCSICLGALLAGV